MTIKTSKDSLESQYTLLITGLQGLNDVDVWILGNKTTKKADVISVFQTCATAIAASDAAHTTWQNALANERAALAVADPLRASVKSFLDGRLGKQNPNLQAFGFKPAKTPARTVASKATAIAKTTATRQARHTMGSNQKKDIHGTVPASAQNAPAAPSTGAAAAAAPVAATPASPAAPVVIAKPAVTPS